MKIANSSLGKAKANKEDEFYTQLTDVEKELKYYKEHFKNKIVFCNCDDPEESNFFKYFALNFKHLGLKKLITTHYNGGGNSYKLEITEDINKDGKINLKDAISIPLKGDGDFRSDESKEILKEADIIVTNPPFSLFRDYMAQVVEFEKNFIIIGSQNAITYKEIFSLIKDNKIWLGYKSGEMEFKVPHHYTARETRYRQDETGQKWRSFGNICWFTNLDIAKRHDDMILYKTYKGNEKDYPKYDNYDAINVGKVAEIPLDYDGAMGVPITFLDKYNPEQFEIIGIDRPLVEEITGKVSRFRIDNKEIYARIVIRNKKL